MKLSPATVCRSKVKYHTERSAIRAVSALSDAYKTRFIYYKCGTSRHFHLTHANISERIGYGNKLILDNRETS